MNCVYRPGVEPWRAGCRSFLVTGVPFTCIGQMVGGYRRDVLVRDGEPVTLTGKDMTILPRHVKMLRKPPEFAQPWHLLATVVLAAA